MEIGLTNRILDPSCGVGTDPAASTDHVMLGNIYGNWVEAGWLELNQGGGVHSFEAFSEWGLNFNVFDFHTYTATCLQPGTYERWQVNNFVGGTGWDTWLDCEDGAGFRYLGPRYVTGYVTGLLAGETAPRGSGTGMSDVHRSIAREDANLNWAHTTSMQCKVDPISNWQGMLVTESRYDTVHGSMNC